MKKLGKWTIFVMICCLILTTIACGKKNDNQADKMEENTTEESTEEILETLDDIEEDVTGSITVWVGSMNLANTKFMEYKRNFEAKYPGTTVHYKVVTDYENAGYQYIKNGNCGDVVMIPECMSDEEIKEIFMPFGTAENVGNQYKEKYVHKFNLDGYIYGLPECIKPQGIAYNKRVLEYSGIVSLPENTTDFIRMLKKILSKNPDVTPFYVNPEDNNLSSWQLHNWGSVTGNSQYHYSVFPMDNEAFAGGGTTYTVQKMLYDIVKNRLYKDMDIRYDEAKAMFNRGQIACMMVDFDELSKLQDAGTNPDDVGYMPFPCTVDGARYATATYGYCYGIPKDCGNKVTAKAFVAYMLKESNYAMSEGAISIKKKTGKPTLLKDFTGVELVIDEPANELNQGKYERKVAASGLDMDTDTLPKMTIQMALGQTEDVDFNSYMERVMTIWNNTN